MKATLLGPCNYYCGHCALYLQKRCSGCAVESAKAAAKGEQFCDIYDCAKTEAYRRCADCAQYPCAKYDKSIFAESFIKLIRDRLKAASKP
jgi:hypothetical protein